ncbi:type VII secretion target [Gordonia amicalis]|uniref:Type VII secretion target n=1 Tax=Gordonia amicalis TaxID=89053 RepID=A0AAE4UCB3_9ACTN|nr:type VII secretion target [Gordonia amicalis]MDV6314597.1 type VII secretion target [Gordonia amicalis]
MTDNVSARPDDMRTYGGVVSVASADIASAAGESHLAAASEQVAGSKTALSLAVLDAAVKAAITRAAEQSEPVGPSVVNAAATYENADESSASRLREGELRL